MEEIDESIFDDDNVSVAVGSTAEASNDDNDKVLLQQDNNIAERESRAVSLVRFLVFFLLIAITAGVAVGVYFYVSNEETKSFENDFRDSSDKAFDAIGSVLDQSLGASDNLMGTAVSHQLFTNSFWPFVTIPNFAVKAQKILTLSRASVIGIYPKVMGADRTAWEEYALENQGWVDESLKVQRENKYFKGTNIDSYNDYPHIHTNEGPSEIHSKYYPTWQTSPVVPRWGPWGWDLYNDYYRNDLDQVEMTRNVVMGQTINLPSSQSTIDWIADRVGFDDVDPSEPLFPTYYPIIGNATDAVDVTRLDPESHQVVGVIATTSFWRRLFENILSPGSRGLVAVIGSDCNQTFTFQIDGPYVKYHGKGDLHNRDYNGFGRFSYMATLGQRALRERQYSGFPLNADYCPYWIRLFPSDDMKAQHESTDPIIFTIVTVSIFIFTTLFFLVYDCVSERRQKKVLQVAVQSTAVVSSLFPQVFRDRIFRSQEGKANHKERMSTARLRLQHFLRQDDNSYGMESSRRDPAAHEEDNLPIAELFSDTTVMFADIAGFTAWSSVREPAQVFTLLETLYGSFDRLAARRGVFKVETIGDSYVAVAGLPDPRYDHAVVMAKFACDVRKTTRENVENLGKTLGPDTAELELRIGLNSGPVTAGVLRGERSRFQLFGDTVNTAARMESTGVVSKIHISQSTADLLIKAGKSHWVTKRDGEVEAKGKGRIQTFWVEPKTRGHTPSSGHDSADEVNHHVQVVDDKTQRLVEWNVEIMVKLLRQIVARREGCEILVGRKSWKTTVLDREKWEEEIGGNGGTVLDEVKEVIMLPKFDHAVAKASRTAKPIELSLTVLAQLRDYITFVATMYTDKPFHNFEHASHVTMSVVKLMSRIIAPSDQVIQEAGETKGTFESTLHDHTYGITSDPLTQFACVFSALIHDVDHPGVPNTQLIKENSPLVAKYKGKSMAEQKSVDLSWKLLMKDQFEDLRMVICNTKSEMARFRQLVANAVMATDIMDKDLKSLRNQRWDKAFSEGSRLGESQIVNTNRKATIVIEHMIQASDVAHTMQHWHIFRKWNERLFEEMYLAYKQGRAEKNPGEFWYQGELGFFDFYVIPLAKKLSDCGVFGVSSEEYLSYAKKNREEWENRGQEVVAAMISKYESVVQAPTRSLPVGDSNEASTTSMAKVLDEQDDEPMQSTTSSPSHFAIFPAICPDEQQEPIATRDFLAV
ncbi:hypothetical protein ACA910_010443 [Epithemia clementina (nom. ined.)]